jgi:hypothetical protein
MADTLAPMPKFSDSKELAAYLLKLLQSSPRTLFAGAGVSKRANLPIWEEYLEILAKVAENYEPMLAGMMRKRAKAGDFLEAARYYKTASDIPIGIKLAELTAPFSRDKYDAPKLYSLCSLPFDLAVTTNYDLALHDAFAKTKGHSIVCAELGDPTLREAVFWKSFYVGRLHGRAEVPNSLVLDTDDYHRIDSDNDYKDLLKSLLRQRSVLFVGFSFLDPAISEILNFIESMGVFPELHHALIPTGQDALGTRLRKQNIEVIEYDPRDYHAVLWDAIEICSKEFGPQTAKTPTTLTSGFDTARRLLATCYAYACMEGDGVALKQTVIEGIALAELSDGTESLEALSLSLRSYMALSEVEADALMRAAVTRLVARGVCMEEDGLVILVSDLRPQTSPVQVLVSGIISRALLREKFEIPPKVERALTCAVEEVLVLRGFDLGAEFSGAHIGEDGDVSVTITEAINRNLPGDWETRRNMLAEVFGELLRHPSPTEEAVLGEVGRISFGIELILQSGRSTIYALALPEQIYLDASFLMPAIVLGHPSQEVYSSAIGRLQEASRDVKGTAVHFADVFLDEIINHRKKAIELVRDGGLDSESILSKRILFYGADKVNVYIGGYSGWLTDDRNRGKTFDTYLNEIAPYRTVAELTTFLRKRGISVVSTRPATTDDSQAQTDTFSALDTGYQIEEAKLGRAEAKPTVLKKHEAAQIHLMQKDIARGRRTILVTADTKLRRAVATSSLSSLRDSLISPRNLVQLVDLLIGIDVPPQALTRLLWSVKAADDRASIKDYLLNRALRHYDEALLLKLNDLLDSYAEKIVREAKLEDIDIGTMKTDERPRVSRFMDRVENEVFENLAEEVRKLRAKVQELEAKG